MKNNSRFENLLSILYIMGLILIIYGLIQYKHNRDNKELEDIQNPREIVNIKDMNYITTLEERNIDNIGEYVRINGRVKMIGSNNDLGISDNLDEYSSVYIKMNNSENVKDLQEDDYITIVGKFSGYNRHNLLITNAYVEDKGPHIQPLIEQDAKEAKEYFEHKIEK